MLLAPGAAPAEQLADCVLVVKSERRLHLLREGEVFASFRVSFGANPEGHKQQEGDERTPEGSYVLDYKNSNSAYSRSIHVSYPNAQDRARAARQGVDPGGQIMVHGQKNGWGWLSPLVQLFDWTDGCIALDDGDMDRVWEGVRAGTPIEIRATNPSDSDTPGVCRTKAPGVGERTATQP